MSRSTLGHSLTPALTTWRELVTAGPTGPGIDFSDTNRTRRCRLRVDSFLADPSDETFRRLWSPETLGGYWRPNAAMLLRADGAIESLHALITEMDSAEQFNSSWLDQLGGTADGWGFYELFGRLQGGHEPIPSIEAKQALDTLGYDVGTDRRSLVTAIETFREDYDSVVGHATARTSYEIPIYAEIDEFFRLIETADRETISSQLTGPYAPLFRPLIGHRVHTAGADPIKWRGVDELIREHIDAREGGAYDDFETEHWGGTHIEIWKWQFAAYFDEVVRSEFDLTALTAAEIPRFFDRIEEPTDEFDAVSNVPAKMMGGQFHRLAWADIVAHCRENPAEAAVVLSDLFDEEIAIADRLNEFYEFCHHLTTRTENDRSPGSLLRAATALLMYAYPDRHITFQYQRLNNFFAAYSTAEGVEMGFNARQYREVAMACRVLLEKLEAYAGNASMIDVQTLIYIDDDA